MFTCFKTFDKYIGCFPLDFCFSRRRKLFPIFLSPILTSLKIWLQAILDTQVVFRAKAFTLSFFLSFCPILSFFLCLSTCQMRLSTVLSLFVYLSNVSFYHFLSVFFFCLVKRYSFFIISNFILLSEALLFPFLLCLSFRLFKHYTFTILSLFPPLYIFFLFLSVFLPLCVFLHHF
jgi:hypothetical protein